MSNTSALYPYLTFDNTKAALAYYQAVFGAEDVERLPVTKAAAEAMHIPSSVNYEDLTMHAVFTILGNWVYSSDNFNHDDQLTNSTRLLIDVDSGDAEMLEVAESGFLTPEDVGQALLSVCTQPKHSRIVELRLASNNVTY